METIDAPAIALSGITKRFGPLTAVKDLDLRVEQGETLGFLGLNGAGKTTTIRILLDLLRPDAGKAFILGRDCQAEGIEARARVGYLPGELGFYGDMTGRETLDLLARLSRSPRPRGRRKELLDRLELSTSDLDRKLREYSSGMKRKLGIIQAFQSDPALLILDEPTEGLDPLMQESLYGLLSEMSRAGRTVFMSSHVLAEVERVCGRIALIREGELVLVSGVDELRKRAPRRVRASFDRDVAYDGARLPAGYEALDIQPRSWTVRVHGPLGPLARALAGLPVEDLHVQEPRLEDVLLEYYRADAR